MIFKQNIYSTKHTTGVEKILITHRGFGPKPSAAGIKVPNHLLGCSSFDLGEVLEGEAEVARLAVLTQGCLEDCIKTI